MGLLDDAIREHLELKRRRGADPGMVAREEHDALTPVFPDEEDDRDGDLADGGLSEASAEEAAGGASVEEQHARDAELADLSTVGQETAELDMQAVMDEDVDVSGDASPAGAPAEGRSGADGYAPGPPEDPPLEWEAASGAGPEPVAEDVPGQERLSFE
jgi:hypothetical protein